MAAQNCNHTKCLVDLCDAYDVQIIEAQFETRQLLDKARFLFQVCHRLICELLGPEKKSVRAGVYKQMINDAAAELEFAYAEYEREERYVKFLRYQQRRIRNRLDPRGI